MNGTPATEKPLTPAAVRRNRVQMQRLRAQSLEIAEDLKLGLMSADRDAKVVKLVDHMLDKGVRLKEIKGSDALAAAKLYVDRRWPVRQEHSPASFSFTNVNLNLFLPDPQPAALDVTPTTICGVEEGGKNEKPDSLNEFNTSNVR
jgi:hypothetical protein